MIGKLVKKDLMYLVTSLKSTLLVCVVLALFLPMGSIGFGLVMPALVCYIGFYNILAYEERSKMNLLNATLPVTRQEICYSKYIQVGIITMASTLLATIGTLCSFGMKGSSTFNLFLSELPEYILLEFVIAMIYAAIILPCVFYWGTLKARYALMFIYILCFIGASNIDKDRLQSLSAYISGSSAIVGGLGLCVIGIVILMVSIGISLKIWEKKDIN